MLLELSVGSGEFQKKRRATSNSRIVDLNRTLRKMIDKLELELELTLHQSFLSPCVGRETLSLSWRLRRGMGLGLFFPVNVPLQRSNGPASKGYPGDRRLVY